MTGHRVIGAALVLALSSPWTVSADEGQPVLVRLEGAQQDTDTLLTQLNEHGRKTGRRFVAVREGYQIEIALHAQRISAMDLATGGGADAYAAVLGSRGDLLFMVMADRRVRRAGAVNAVAQQIVKRLPATLEPAATPTATCTGVGVTR